MTHHREPCMSHGAHWFYESPIGFDLLTANELFDRVSKSLTSRRPVVELNMFH